MIQAQLEEERNGREEVSEKARKLDGNLGIKSICDLELCSILYR